MSNMTHNCNVGVTVKQLGQAQALQDKWQKKTVTLKMHL